MTIKKTAIALGSAKAKLDLKIGSFVDINEQIKALKKKADTLKNDIESKYTLDADQTEMLQGTTFYAQKIPVLINRVWDVDGLKQTLTNGGVKGISKIVTRRVVHDVDEKAIKQLIKDNVVTEADVYANQSGDRTFKSQFGRVADLVAAAQEAEAKAKKAEAKAAKEAEKAIKAQQKAEAKATKAGAKVNAIKAKLAANA